MREDCRPAIDTVEESRDLGIELREGWSDEVPGELFEDGTDKGVEGVFLHSLV